MRKHGLLEQTYCTQETTAAKSDQRQGNTVAITAALEERDLRFDATAPLRPFRIEQPSERLDIF
jgi:hypothetical protein